MQLPLSVVPANELHGDYIEDATGATVADLYVKNKHGFVNFSCDSAEHARRIVACVNACEGIATEKLEAERLMNDVLRHHYMSAVCQRDELLATLQSVLNYIPASKIGAVRAVIAKVQS
jgi:hypothetical protein